MSIHSRALHQVAGSTRNVSRALAALVLLFGFAASAIAGVSVSINVAPPALPVYVQPPCPGDGYIWTPGYWAWGDGDYYWVPGTWVLAPEPGLLWTPGYWAWDDVHFVFHEGYWASDVGFYGGINYGFGYGGVGFEGGYWRGAHFYYNRAVANISEANVRNVYTKTVIHNTINVVSYNGGTGGTTAHATAEELRAATERHVPPVAAQSEHVRLARNNPALREESDHGRPPIAATQHAHEFSGNGVVKASRAGEPYHPAAERRVAARGTQAKAVRPAEDARPSLAEQPNTDRQHASNEHREAKPAARIRQQQELTRQEQEKEEREKQEREKQEREKQELEAQHKQRHPAEHP
jgi:hypothetical protein